MRECWNVFQIWCASHHSEVCWLSPDKKFSHTTATAGHQQYSKQQILRSGYILYYQIKYSTTVPIYPRNKTMYCQQLLYFLSIKICCIAQSSSTWNLNFCQHVCSNLWETPYGVTDNYEYKRVKYLLFNIVQTQDMPEHCISKEHKHARVIRFGALTQLVVETENTAIKVGLHINQEKQNIW